MMRFPLRARWLLLGALLLTSAGCFKLGRTQPTLQQYVLGGGTARAADVPPMGGSAAAGLAIGVRRLDLATYLAIPAVVVRRGESRIVLSEFHRWAEDLDHGINRVLAAYLARQPAVRSVDVAPWPVRSDHDYLLQLHVTRFEGVAPEDTAAVAGSVHVQAGWEITQRRTGLVRARGATDFREAGWRVDDYAALIVLLDNGLSVLAADVAQCLARLGTPAASASDTTRPGLDHQAPITCGAAAE